MELQNVQKFPGRPVEKRNAEVLVRSVEIGGSNINSGSTFARQNWTFMRTVAPQCAPHHIEKYLKALMLVFSCLGLVILCFE